MPDLTSLAEGKPCYLRLAGCLASSETVVLAHIRRGNIAGGSQKPSDFCAIPMCGHCHDLYDRRVPSAHSRAQLDADALRGLVQWLSYLEKHGYISVAVPA